MRNYGGGAVASTALTIGEKAHPNETSLVLYFGYSQELSPISD